MLSEANRLAANSLKEVLGVFSNAARKFKRKYGKIPVLIIDNANKIEATQLLQMQDFAKSAYDKGLATVAFVVSEGRVPHIMMERSSWSRHGRILEICDVNEKEALDYLKYREISDRDAQKIYNLIGGRMIDLNLSADIIKSVVIEDAKVEDKKFDGTYGCSMQKIVLVLTTLQLCAIQ